MNTETLLKASMTKLKALFTTVAEAKQKTEDPAMLVDAKGRHCPVDIISAVDLARDALVRDRNQQAADLSKLIEDFKNETFADIDAFIAISNAEHGAKIGILSENSKRAAWKGNLQLINYNNTQKIRLMISDRIAFNEKLHSAMTKMQQLISQHSSGVDEIIKVLINEAFRVDKTGQIDAKKIMELRRYKIKHELWQSAMQDINDSIQIVGSKAYLQFYTRDTPESEWQSIPLDIARV
jgi:hypothetical protein